MEQGCRFRVTGNLVWLCSTTIPPIAINTIRPWDDLQFPAPAVGDVAGSEDKGGIWGPDEEEWELEEEGANPPAPVTERIVQVVKDIAPAVEGCGPGQVVDLDTNTWEIEFKEQPEASFSPGHAEEGCDWSGDEDDLEVVEAAPATSKAEPEEDDPMGVKFEDDSRLGEMKREPVQEAASSSGALKHEAPEDPGFDSERAVRKVLRFGSAQIRILQEVAMADATNWSDLQKCIKEQEDAGPRAKAQLLDQLHVLADIKAESREGAIAALESHKQKALEVSELEAQYKNALDEEAKRLERFNPVGPRTSQPLITTNRLEADIAAGMGIWQARRDHRARERAARHRLALQSRAGAPVESAGTLVDVPTEAHAEVIDMTMQDRAKAALAEFRQELQQEGERQDRQKKARQKDSLRRKQLKRERYRDKKRTRRTHDDAERDSNHAIAHTALPWFDPEARFAPGNILLTVSALGVAFMMVGHFFRGLFRQPAAPEGLLQSRRKEEASALWRRLQEERQSIDVG